MKVKFIFVIIEECDEIDGPDDLEVRAAELKFDIEVRLGIPGQVEFCDWEVTGDG